MFILDAIKAYAKTNRVALMNREETLSFAELDVQSDAFAAWLLAELGDDRTPIVIYGHKETAFLPCIFGALKSGRGYVPIDRSVPPERAAQIIADVLPKAVIDFGGLDCEINAMRLDSDELRAILYLTQVEPPSSSHWISGDTPAYILFTSGSTGRPKGVPITTDNLSGFYQGLLPYYPAKTGGVILNQISYSFDVSGCSLYVGLAKGMTLFTIDHAMMEDMGQLFLYLQRSNLTLWVSTPSFAELCIHSAAFSGGHLPHLRQFLFCGEVLTHTLCDQLAERFPKAWVLNTYGPTEATVLVTAVEITKELRRDSRPIPIGRAIAGTELRLLGADGRTVEDEEQSGELLILGASVSPGYFARPDLSEKAFFTDTAGKQGYRTGDICYRKGDLYYYCGRVDNQLKLNGFRVEIEDIESNLQKLPNIVRAVVVPMMDGERVQYLAAFLLLKQPDGLAGIQRSMQVKRVLAEYLPAYMIPRKLFAVDSFPLNTNGKVDKKALAYRLQEGNQ